MIKKEESFLTHLFAPARRSLENNGISTTKQLSKYTEAEILNLHGMGPSSRKDGTKLRSGHFKKGKQVGEWTTYDKLGQVYKVTKIKG